ncbi:MAG: LysM peptidoglycan-binding domain-containing protein [Cyanobacteria bacterium]|nr:LysM peptidoglycan-binding domain-containing protein [Cyanobacteriota bacterium]
MQANGISNADLVVVGQRLTIPGSAAASRPTGAATVTVQPGDTLSDIAAREGVGLSQLMQANGISNADLVVVGQRLSIPGRRAAVPAAAARPNQPTATYTVKSGEILSEIAARFNTSTERLIQLNAIRDPNLVISGTRLQVPVPPRPPAPKPPAVNRNAQEHVVRPGESLSVLAERYGTSVSRLVALNQLEDPERLLVGTRLKLRGTPPAPKATPKPTPTKPAPTAAPAPQPAATTTAAAAPTPTPTASAPAAAAPTTAPTAAVAATPAAVATASPASTPAPQPAQASRPQAAQTQPAARQAPASQPSTSAAPSRLAQATAATATSPATTSRTTTSPSPAAASTTGAATSRKPSGDWRTYGPLQIDWSKLQAMGGSYVAPSLNGEGQALYLGVNCTARKINVTSQTGQWKTWETPSKDFEQKLVQDVCQAKGG